MKQEVEASTFSRRTVIVGAGSLAGSLAASDSVLAQGGTVMKSDLEVANEKLVNDFCADWSTRDIDRLADYLAEDIVYQMFEGRPDIVGREEFKKTLGGFLQNLESVEWEILRSNVIGPLVINERMDHFNASTEEKSMHFQIAGYFLVQDGKITVWKDYSMPGGITQVGSQVGSPDG